MERNEEKISAHCLIFPVPAQGHINPMLQFAKRLLHKRIKIGLILTKHLANTTHNSSNLDISIHPISDGFDCAIPADIDPGVYLARFEEIGSTSLKELMQELADSGQPVDCVIYDPFLTWPLKVAKELGVYTAAFFTQSCAVDHIYHHVYEGRLKLPLSGSEEEILIPGLPPLRPQDLPSFISEYGTYPPLLEMVVNQFTGMDKADWLFFNTFYKLEEEAPEPFKRKRKPLDSNRGGSTS